MKTLALLVLPLLAACASATPETADVRAPRSDNEFITGSRIPGKGRVTTIDREELERMRAGNPQAMPDALKDGPPK